MLGICSIFNTEDSFFFNTDTMKALRQISIIIFSSVLLTISFIAKGQELNNLEELNIQLAKGNNQTVINLANKYLSQNKQDDEIYYIVGLAYQNQAQYEKALKAFLNAYKINNDDFRFIKSIGACNYSLGNMQKAKVFYKMALKKSPDDITVLNALGKIYLIKDNFKKAISIYKHLYKLDTANSYFCHQMGKAYSGVDSTLLAISFLTEAFNLNNSNIGTIFLLNQLLVTNSAYEKSIKILSRGIELDSTNSGLYRRRANTFYLTQYYTSAAKDYFKAVQNGDKSGFVIKQLGMSHFKSDNFEAAAEYLLYAHQLDTADYESCYYLGLAYSNSYQAEKGNQYLKKSIDLLKPNPVTMANLYNAMAKNYIKTEKYNEALNVYDKQLEYSKNPLIYYQKGLVYDRRLNEKEKALVDYNTFLQKTANSKNENAIRIREYINELITRIKEDLHFAKTND